MPSPVSLHDLLVDRTLIGVAAVGLFLWDFWLERRGPTERERKLRGRLFAAMASLAFAAWWNFGLFHLDHWTHLWDIYGQYMGSKYSPELGYTGVYACTAVAEVELGFGAEMAERQIRDLRTDRLAGAADLIRAERTDCHGRFTPERWGSFRSDVAFFRSRFPSDRWRASFQDHGYNPTPAWGLGGRLFASLGPSSDEKVFFLTLLDPLLIFFLWTVAIRTFGMGAACVGLVWWGLNTPADFGWIGGCFLRFDWLALCVAGVALLKTKRPFAAGVALTFSTLLRVFPGFFIVGLVLKAAAEIAASRRLRLSREHARFAAGCLVTLTIAVPLSGLVASGGHSVLGPWKEFVANSRKHLATPSMNNMGLRDVLSWTPEEPLTFRSDEEPIRAWWVPHEEAFSRRRPLFFALVSAAVLLVAGGVRGRED